MESNVKRIWLCKVLFKRSPTTICTLNRTCPAHTNQPANDIWRTRIRILINRRHVEVYWEMVLRQAQEVPVQLERQAIDRQVVGLRWRQLKLTQCKRNAIHLNSLSNYKDVQYKKLSMANFSFSHDICSRYENHSPSTTQGNGTSSTSERDERNGTDKAAELNIKHEVNFLNNLKNCNANLINLSFPLQTGAEDLRMKMEMRQLQSPLASSAPPTPTTPLVPYASTKGIPVGLEGTIAPADMLNVLSAHRESVHTADGKESPTQNELQHTNKNTWRFSWSWCVHE